MKQFKTVRLVISLIVIYFYSTSFTIPVNVKSEIISDFYYTCTNRLIQTGKSSSLNLNELSDSNNWSVMPPSIVQPEVGVYLRAIRFEFETCSNGPSNGKLSLTEAITLLKDYYANHYTLSNDYINIENISIVVKKQIIE